jgi:hypothetical protein
VKGSPDCNRRSRRSRSRRASRRVSATTSWLSGSCSMTHALASVQAGPECSAIESAVGLVSEPCCTSLAAASDGRPYSNARPMKDGRIIDAGRTPQLAVIEYPAPTFPTIRNPRLGRRALPDAGYLQDGDDAMWWPRRPGRTTCQTIPPPRSKRNSAPLMLAPEPPELITAQHITERRSGEVSGFR